MGASRLALSAALASALAFAHPAQAATDEPVVLHADSMDYDREHDIVIAEGKVEVTQGKMILLADTLTYDRRNSLVYAQGNVSVLEPDGNVYFADNIQLNDDMASGVAEVFRARLSDGSLLAANGAVRESEDVTRLQKAVYSPCKIVCKDGTTPKTPTWQMKAGEAVVDRAEQTITYKNAWFETMGLPVIYTPYFSHAMPGADNKSGLLIPEYKNNNNLGSVVKAPVYWAISPTQDMTLLPIYTSLEAPVLAGEYRQLLDYGSLKFTGSVTRPDRRDALGNPIQGTTTRGHLFGDGNFDVDPDWRWGFNIRRSSDDTYLRKYDFGYEPLLTSRLYGEGFNFTGEGSRSYFITQALAFQGQLQQDDKERSPFVTPVMDFHYETPEFSNGSRLALTANAMSLTRDLGADSRRLSVAGKWILPYVTEGGHVLEFTSQIRADTYDVQNLFIPGTLNSQFDGQETRVIPMLTAGWRYPLMRRFESANWIVEPVVNAIVSPNNSNTYKIPNEDSAIPEFTDTNLFSENRFAGYDRVEVGPRLNYGLRSQLAFDGGWSLDGVFGQTYRVNDDPLFPISNDLNSRFSDYVGRVAVSYDPVLLAYRFRRDKDTFTSKRDEIEAELRFKRIQFAANYVDIRNDPILASRQDVNGGVTFALAENWSWTGSMHRDLLLDKYTNATTGLAFHNECITVNMLFGRAFTSDRDFRESNSFTLQVLLKNLN